MAKCSFYSNLHAWKERTRLKGYFWSYGSGLSSILCGKTKSRPDGSLMWSGREQSPTRVEKKLPIRAWHVVQRSHNIRTRVPKDPSEGMSKVLLSARARGWTFEGAKCSTQFLSMTRLGYWCHVSRSRVWQKGMTWQEAFRLASCSVRSLCSNSETCAT